MSLLVAVQILKISVEHEKGFQWPCVFVSIPNARILVMFPSYLKPCIAIFEHYSLHFLLLWRPCAWFKTVWLWRCCWERLSHRIMWNSTAVISIIKNKKRKYQVVHVRSSVSTKSHSSRSRSDSCAWIQILTLYYLWYLRDSRSCPLRRSTFW